MLQGCTPVTGVVRLSGAMLIALVAACVLATAASAYWTPAPRTTWQYQLDGTLDTTIPAQVFDIDGEFTTAADVAVLHTQGKRVIAYFTAGVAETYRPWYYRYPPQIIGSTTGWNGERYVDIRRWDILEPILRDLVVMARDKGFDGIDWDYMANWEESTGFPISYQDSLTFDRNLAALVHSYGLSVGLKNDPYQVADLVSSFDYMVDEQCYQYQECEFTFPFISAGKAVFAVEYRGTPSTFCPYMRAHGLSGIRKRKNVLALPWTTC